MQDQKLIRGRWGERGAVVVENIFLQKYLQIFLKSALPYNLLPETDLKRVNKKVNTAINKIIGI